MYLLFLRSAIKAGQARARAKGEADAEILRAEGAAEANRLISQSLTPAVLQYQAIDRPADKIQITLIPAGEGLILDPATLLKPIEGVDGNTGSTK